MVILYYSYSVMLQCWNSDPEERPSFSALEKIMSKMEMKHEVGILRNRLHILGSKFCMKITNPSPQLKVANTIPLCSNLSHCCVVKQRIGDICLGQCHSVLPFLFLIKILISGTSNTESLF